MLSPVFVRTALAALLVVAITGIVVVAFRDGSSRSSSEPTVHQQLPQNIDIALRNARFSEMRNGQIVWELTADQVGYDRSGEIAHLAGIRMDFATGRAPGTVTVTANKGDYYGNSKNIRLNGNVHLVTGDGGQFDTNSVDYSAAASQFTTHDPVRFRQQRLSLSAVGMILDVREQRSRFITAVDATVAGVRTQ